MSPWVRNTFLTVLPKLLLMRRPHYSPRYFKFYWNRSIASKYYSTYLNPKWASNLEIKDIFAKNMTKLHHKKSLDTSLYCNDFYKSASMVHLIVSCIVWMKELLYSMFYDAKNKDMLTHFLDQIVVLLALVLEISKWLLFLSH